MAAPAPILPSRNEVGVVSDAAYIQATLSTVLSQRELWLPAVRYLPEQRWYQRFEHTADGQDFGGEVWLISWPSGTQTGLHDHGGSPGAFVVVDGELTEQTIAGAGTDTPRLRNHTKTPGRPRMFGAYHLHNVGNVSPGHALSVHVYTPALTSMSRYAWTPRGAEAVSIDRVGQDW